MNIEQRMRERIEGSGMTHAAVAAAAGMTKFQLSKVLHGTRELGAAEFLRLCLVLGVSPETFMDCDELDMKEEEE